MQRGLLMGAMAAMLPWLVGCSGLVPSAATIAPLVHASGRVVGGQQPVAGATIQMYAANLTAQQGAATALIGSTVVTDAQGGFDITGKYSCPPGAMVYLVATGGNPGLSGSNPALGLMTGLGSCSTLTPSTFIAVNEVTTVATAYALRPYMLDYAHTGATAGDNAGLANAFLTIQSLVNTANGTMPGVGLPASASVPVNELNSLADVLAGCVNSSGATAACTGLFAATGGGTNTIAAALGIAGSPASSVGTIFNLIAPGAPFQPVLSSAPNDWSVAITLTGGGLNGPYGIAIDGGGNAWVTNASSNAVSKFNALGATAAGANGFTGGGLLGAQSVAIDLAGNVWIANTAGNSVVKMSSVGAVLSGAGGFTSGGISAPIAIALDKQGNAWVADYGSSVTELSSAGVASGGSPLILGGHVSRPTAIGVDPSGNIWVSSAGTGALVAFTSSGGTLGAGLLTDGWLQGTGQLAIDAAGNAWVAAPGINALTAIGPAYVPVAAGSPDYNGSLALPFGVVADGAGNLWVTNRGAAGSISKLAAGTGANVAGAAALGALSLPVGIAVDGSGNVWTANSGSNTVTIFVGLAAPAVTPLVAQLP